MFNSYLDAVSYLENLRGVKKTEEYKLSNINNLLEKLGNPQLSYKVIHITGTNGKGSTSFVLSNLINNLGYKVGLFISPYVIKFNERISINNIYISNDDIVKYLNIVYKYIDYTYSFFEVITAMMFLYFKDNNCKYVVLEAGIGGLYDVTNVNTNKVLTLITSISYDHINILGNTLDNILINKLGITRKNVLNITFFEDKFKGIYELKQSKINFKNKYLYKDEISYEYFNNKLYISYKNSIYKTKMLGDYQAYNLILAIEGFKYLFNNCLDDYINKVLENLIFPCRFEYIKDNIIIDGAHNIDGAINLKKTINTLNLENITLVYSSLKDKDYISFLNEINSVVNEYIFVIFNDNRLVDFNLITPIIKKPYKIIDIDNLEFSDNKLYICTGSLHFASSVRNLLK